MRLLNTDSVRFFAWNRENKTCEKRRKFDMFALQTKTLLMLLKRVYSEICVIRVQIFILVSLLCEFVTFCRKRT